MDNHKLQMLHSSEWREWATVWLVDRLELGADGCWYLHGRKRDAYPILHYQGESIGAHVTAYLLSRQTTVPPLHVCHRCDHKGCWRPDHLFPGNHSINLKDSYAKGLRVHPVNPNAVVNLGNPRQGERNAAAKLTADQVRQIRQLAPTHNRTLLTHMFGVSRTGIRDVVNRRIWKHVE
jgi:hypothetical protein